MFHRADQRGGAAADEHDPPEHPVAARVAGRHVDQRRSPRLVVVPNKLGSTDFGTFGYAAGIRAVLRTGRRDWARRFSCLGPSPATTASWARTSGTRVLLKLAVWAVLSHRPLSAWPTPSATVGRPSSSSRSIARGCCPYLLSEVFFGALTGMQRIARPAMWTVVQIYFQTVVGILVLELGGGVVAYAVVVSIGGRCIPMVATALMVRPLVRGHRVFDFRIWRLLVVGGAPLLALAFLNLIYGTLDVPILHAIAGSEPVGWYAVALRWVGIPIFITTAVVTAYYPGVLRARETR